VRFVQMKAALANPIEDRSTAVNRALVAAFLEKVPDYVYFKDRQSRFIAVSKSLVRYLGRTNAADIIGRTDFAFFETSHAQQAFDDEQRVLRTGQPLLGKLECETPPSGETTWLVTNKVPLKDERGAVIGTFGMSKDVTKTRQMEGELEKAHKELVDASRSAGMAEVATGVLHNVGNVLNSLNVSASVIGTGLRMSKAESLAKLGALLREHQSGLAEFLTHHPKGKRVPEFLASLARHAVEERNRLLEEISALQKNIDHIKEIVAMQQTYATMVGVVEPLDPAAMMDDSLRMNAAALTRHEINVTREFQVVPRVLGEKAKILQVLVNLIRNAKYACDETGSADKRVTVRLASAPGPGRVQFIVEDNGIGIPPENLTRIFGHGFTTRANGHGFGLHSAANAAREMKGSLTVHSDGRGKGATFTLELPAAPAAHAATYSI
jgi:PAS domain S-box-containing protein